MINPEESNARKQALLRMLVLSRMEESPEDPQVGRGSRVSAGFVPRGKFCCSRLRIKTDNLIHVCFSFPQRLPSPPTMKRCLISLKIREMQNKSREILFSTYQIDKDEKVQ